MGQSNYFKGIFLISLAALFWSSAGLFIKIIDRPPMQIAFYRSLIAGIFLFGYLAYQKLILKTPFDFKLTKWSFLTALCYVFTVSLFVLANKLTTSANAVFLQYTAPVYVIVISYVFLRERIFAIEVATVVISLVGMVLFFIEAEKSTALIGNIVGIFSGIAFALLQIVVKRSEKSTEARNDRLSDMKGIFNLALGNSATVLVLLVIVVSVIFLINPTGENSFLTYTFGSDFRLTSRDLLGLLFLGVFQLGLGYIFFAKGAKFISSVEIAIYTLLEPICNPVWTFLGTGEIPGLWPLVGGGLVLSAMVVNSIFKKNENE